MRQILKPGPDGGSTGSIGDTGGGTLVILAAGSISIAGSASITASGVAGTGGAIYGAGGSGANGAPTTTGCSTDGYSAGGGEGVASSIFRPPRLLRAPSP